MGEKPSSALRPRGPTRRGPAPSAAGIDVRPYISSAAAVLAGVANVVMQLSRPEVGYGVKESRVTSGSAMKHPVKRARTTFTYLAVAMLGSDSDVRAYRRAVNAQHRQVRSTAASPVEYDAMSPELQLWVAACLYYGMVDVYERMHGALPAGEADRLYEHAARFGTCLQVRRSMWPADRSAFDAYWQASMGRVSIDEPVRGYLTDLISLENLPAPLRLALAPRSRFWTAGFLPPELRSQMHLEWSGADQDRFDRRLRLLGHVENLLPVALRVLPFELLLRDMRLRGRLGRRLV